jgi:hypothetical protein
MLVLSLLLTACGGDDGEEEGEGGETAKCEGEALAADQLGLPADFPAPEGLTLVEAEEEGPSRAADGYFDGDVQAAHDAMKSALEGASYKITFDEVERDDSEITYITADDKSTGIVELRASCGGEDPVAVHITNRPNE